MMKLLILVLATINLYKFADCRICVLKQSSWSSRRNPECYIDCAPQFGPGKECVYPSDDILWWKFPPATLPPTTRSTKQAKQCYTDTDCHMKFGSNFKCITSYCLWFISTKEEETTDWLSIVMWIIVVLGIFGWMCSTFKRSLRNMETQIPTRQQGARLNPSLNWGTTPVEVVEAMNRSLTLMRISASSSNNIGQQTSLDLPPSYQIALTQSSAVQFVTPHHLPSYDTSVQEVHDEQVLQSIQI